MIFARFTIKLTNKLFEVEFLKLKCRTVILKEESSNSSPVIMFPNTIEEGMNRIIP